MSSTGLGAQVRRAVRPAEFQLPLYGDDRERGDFPSGRIPS
jgi:hypothetical protein